MAATGTKAGWVPSLVSIFQLWIAFIKVFLIAQSLLIKKNDIRLRRTFFAVFLSVFASVAFLIFVFVVKAVLWRVGQLSCHYHSVFGHDIVRPIFCKGRLHVMHCAIHTILNHFMRAFDVLFGQFGC